MRYYCSMRKVGILLTLALATPVFCLADTGLKIQPVKISETMQPGDTLTGSIAITNVSDTDVNVSITVQDFVPLAGADTIQFVGRAPGVTSVRDWIQVAGPLDSVFKKGEERNISYTINAPANAEPGGHFGVVLFKATPHVEGGGSIQVGTQVGMLVLVAIPGSHTEAGRIVSFSAPVFLQTGPVPFTLNFENTGTVHFEPRGKITIRNMFGHEVANVPIEGVVVLPSSIKKMEFDWNVSGFLFGRYSAHADIVDGSGTTIATADTSFWVIPVWYTLAFVLVLIVIFLILRFIKRRVRITFT